MLICLVVIGLRGMVTPQIPHQSCGEVCVCNDPIAVIIHVGLACIHIPYCIWNACVSPPYALCEALLLAGLESEEQAQGSSMTILQRQQPALAPYGWMTKVHSRSHKSVMMQAANVYCCVYSITQCLGVVWRIEHNSRVQEVFWCQPVLFTL